ncbi:NUMOD4 domain-containing protein [Limosilactobacillus reuteri]
MNHFGKKVTYKGARGMERWKPIEGYEDYYLVSNKGNVKSIRSKKILKPRIGDAGYYYLVFSVHGKRKTVKIHRLVANAFIPNPNNLPMINHKDENKLNNNVNNLEWCTPKYNTNYGSSITKRVRSRIRNGNTRRIVAVNIFTKEKYIFSTRYECARVLGVSHQSIRQFLNDKSRCRCKKYIFIDFDNYSKELENKLIQRALHPKTEKRRVTVFTNSGKEHFDSLSKAARFLNASPGHLFNSLRKETLVKGYKVVEGWV